MHYLYSLEDRKIPAEIGNKARQLAWLNSHRHRIPPTFFVTFSAHTAFEQNSSKFLEQFRVELKSVIKQNCRYALRSSANVEDSLRHSFAGQFITCLGLSSVDEILLSAERIYSSATGDSVKKYLQETGLENQPVKVGLILQEMVDPVIAGVAFNRNPISGMNEIIIEAVSGSSQELLQGGITPRRWVYKSGVFTESPPEIEIENKLILCVAEETLRIAKEFKHPVDLEWIFDGRELFWLQLRPITGLEDIKVYSNRIPREVLPGLIKPLIWSVNVPIVNKAWVRFFAELIGKNSIDPETLAKSFYYRAYFDMGTIGNIFVSLGLPRESIQIVMGSHGSHEKLGIQLTPQIVLKIPRLIYFLYQKLRFPRLVQPFLHHARSEYDLVNIPKANRLSDQEILNRIEQLWALTEKTAYANIVIPLLMGAYNMLLRRQLQKIGVDYANVDLTSGLHESDLSDMNHHLEKLYKEFSSFKPDIQDKVRQSQFHELQTIAGIDAFRSEIENLVRQFGHLSDSGNDFSAIPFRENPDLLLKMIINYESNHRVSKKIGWDDIELSRSRRLLLTPLYQRARQLLGLRDQVGSIYTYGYGLFRIYFLALGDHLRQRNLIESPEDIFYLYFEEIKQLISNSRQISNPKSIIQQRKQEMEACRFISLPEVIIGDQPPPLLGQTNLGELLRGIASSRGYYQGPVKVLHSVSEITKLNRGDVLVIPYSDISWTPLFPKAGAVVAESGGMLSHSSIVAREYGIPCIVSVPEACRLKDNTIVSIDGYKGEVRVISKVI